MFIYITSGVEILGSTARKDKNKNENWIHFIVADGNIFMFLFFNGEIFNN